MEIYCACYFSSPIYTIQFCPNLPKKIIKREKQQKTKSNSQEHMIRVERDAF